jgi:hypothetical protein
MHRTSEGVSGDADLRHRRHELLDRAFSSVVNSALLGPFDLVTDNDGCQAWLGLLLQYSDGESSSTEGVSANYRLTLNTNQPVGVTPMRPNSIFFSFTIGHLDMISNSCGLTFLSDC